MVTLAAAGLAGSAWLVLAALAVFVGMIYTKAGALEGDTLYNLNRQTAPLAGILSGAADALALSGSYLVASTVVDAMTLGTPVAGSPSPIPGGAVTAPTPGGQDGNILFVEDIGGHAHTITTAANIVNGSKHIITFNGTLGSFVELIAYNGVWYVTASSGISLS